MEDVLIGTIARVARPARRSVSLLPMRNRRAVESVVQEVDFALARYGNGRRHTPVSALQTRREAHVVERPTRSAVGGQGKVDGPLLALVLVVPVLVALVLAIALALPLSIFWAILANVTESPAGLAVFCIAATAIAFGVIELKTRWVRGRFFRRVVDLGHLTRAEPPSGHKVGSKVLGLGRLRGLALPVPEAIVLTAALGDRLAQQGVRDGAGFFSELSRFERRRVRRFLGDCHSDVVVRASFADADADHCHVGIFAHARAVASDPDAVAKAVVQVLRAADSEAARAYRKQHKLVSATTRAIILQRDVGAGVSGVAYSRGLEGEGDSVIIDYGRRRSPVRTIEYDLLTSEVRSFRGDGSMTQRVEWMRLVALSAVILEERFGTPVRLQYAVARDRLYLLEAQPVRRPARATWTCQWPVDSGSHRLPALSHDLRGGLEIERLGIVEALALAGIRAEVRADHFRYIDGAPYVDVRLLRAVLAAQSEQLLLGSPVASLLRLMRPAKLDPLPRLPASVESTPEGWSAWRKWHAEHFVRAAKEHWKLMTLRLIIDAAARTVASVSESESLRARVLCAALEWRSKGYERRCEELRKFLEQAEGLLADLARRVLARGVQAWDQMFAGDKHLHLGLDMIDRWMNGDEQTRRSLDAKWRERRTALAQREDRPAVPRLHQPALSKVADAQHSDLVGIGLVSGQVAGTAVPVDKNGPAKLADGSIAILPDGRADHCRYALAARGVVLLGGGVLSPVATLAAELGIPTILCAQARAQVLHSGRPISINGTSGVIEV